MSGGYGFDRKMGGRIVLVAFNADGTPQHVVDVPRASYRIRDDDSFPEFEPLGASPFPSRLPDVHVDFTVHDDGGGHGEVILRNLDGDWDQVVEALGVPAPPEPWWRRWWRRIPLGVFR